MPSTDITGAIRSSAAALRHQVYQVDAKHAVPDECPFLADKKRSRFAGVIRLIKHLTADFRMR